MRKRESETDKQTEEKEKARQRQRERERGRQGGRESHLWRRSDPPSSSVAIQHPTAGRGQSWCFPRRSQLATRTSLYQRRQLGPNCRRGDLRVAAEGAGWGLTRNNLRVLQLVATLLVWAADRDTASKTSVSTYRRVVRRLQKQQLTIQRTECT